MEKEWWRSGRGMEKWFLDYKGTHGKEKEWKCLWCVVYENEMFGKEMGTHGNEVVLCCEL